MTKQQIIDYIMETPQNTNPAILSQMLDEVAGEGGGSGYLGLHTATVNVTFDTSKIRGEVVAIEYAYIDLLGANDSTYAIKFTYNDSTIPVIELGTPTQMQIPVSDNYPVYISSSTFSWLNTSLSALLAEEITLVSGEATQDEYGVYITGDCSLNIKVIYQD